MRVVFIIPPSPAGTTINREGAAGLGNRYESAGAFFYPPQLLTTAAAILREAGMTPLLLDATGEQWNLDETLRRVQECRADVAVVQVSWHDWDTDQAFNRALREQFPGLPQVVVGTVFRQVEYAEAAAGAGQFVVVGEPERALPAACMQALEKGPAVGVVAPARDLAPAHYDADNFLLDLESLPMPAWDLAPIHRYRALTLLTSRGCEAGCLYCPYVVGWGTRFRACSPRRAVDELEWLAHTFRPARIIFRDVGFAHDRDRVVGICEEIRKRRLRVAWECESRPEYFDTELLRVMQKAGCVLVKIGVESTDLDRLVREGRVANIDAAQNYLKRVEEVIFTCHKIGLRCQMFVMVGWPGTTEEEIETTAAYIRHLKPHHLTVNAVIMYPGTAWNAPTEREDSEVVKRHRDMLLAQAMKPAALKRPLWRKVFSRLRRMLG